MLLTEMLRSIRGDSLVAEIQFFQTAMGRTFFEHTMPALVKELQKLNETAAKLSKQLTQEERAHGEPRGAVGAGVGSGDGGR